MDGCMRYEWEGIHGTCSKGKQAEYTTAEKCDTEHKERGGGYLGTSPRKPSM